MIKKIVSFLSLFCLFFAIAGVSANQVRVMDAHFDQFFGAEKGSNAYLITEKISNLSVWGLFAVSEQFIRQDIKALLTDPQGREQKFNIYMHEGSLTLRQLERHRANIASNFQSLSDEYHQCELQLGAANRDLITAMKNNNEHLFESTVNSARDARICMADLQVSMNANRNIFLKLDRHISLLDTKYTYLMDNQEFILHHYDLLEPALLRKLQAIAETLDLWEANGI